MMQKMSVRVDGRAPASRAGNAAYIHSRWDRMRQDKKISNMERLRRRRVYGSSLLCSRTTTAIPTKRKKRFKHILKPKPKVVNIPETNNVRIVFLQRKISNSTIKKIIGFNDVDNVEIYSVSLKPFNYDIIMHSSKFVRNFETKSPEYIIQKLDSPKTVFVSVNYKYSSLLSKLKPKLDGLIIQSFNDSYATGIRTHPEMQRRELEIYEVCDGFITPNDNTLTFIPEYYCNIENKPGITFPLYTSRSLFLGYSEPPDDFIVTYGGTTGFDSHRDYRKYFKSMSEQKIFISHYGNRGYDKEEAGGEYYRYFGNEEYMNLIFSYSKCTAGFFGYGIFEREGILIGANGIGNKIFDYMAAGIPIICLEEFVPAAEFIENNNIGIVFDSELNGLGECQNKLDELRYNIHNIREQYTIEAAAHKFMNFIWRLFDERREIPEIPEEFE
jgi:hypothetical protein